ncbi:mitotic spindle checkpoint component mad2 [Zygosaccharomyces mellis]|uniref:Mitotic spindle checkpoint component mad2 n=1 Tax=Zygosaccharomyces mellis TaxID=42258 RepID=A0A4C2E8H4_9SACH|nr:mitotic spindle checkpoint component mad2 [Zygosaccharomyces mellis]
MSNSISLRGSTKTITEFFEYSINSILYQRGVYPQEDFTTVRKYGLTLLKTHDEELKAYIRRILAQVHKWLVGGKCNKLVLCIINKDEGDKVEEWSFDVVQFRKLDQNQIELPQEVDENETQNQIRSLVRQITASVTFLPEINNEGNYTFNVLAYTDANAKVPLEWSDSDNKPINNSETVQFKSFHTNEHQVGAQVSYRY